MLGIRELYYLNLSHNVIESVPEIDFGFRTLDLSYNNIRELPKTIKRNIVNSFYISSNYITSLENLPNSVTYLDASHNYITEMPPSVSKALPTNKNIDYNYLVCSQFSSYPFVLKSCNQSRQYSCADKTLSECDELKDKYGICTPNGKRTSCHRYTNTAREFCEVADELGIEGCQDIYPDGNCSGTYKFHGFVYNCENDLIVEYSPSSASTMLKKVPKGISRFVNLTTVNLSGLNLTSLPKSYNNFNYTTVFNFTYNRFTDIPAAAYGLNYLTHLYISHNKFRTLPGKFFYQSKLTHFYAHHNYLSNFTDSFYDTLAHIKYINLNYNFLACYSYDARRVCDSSYQFVCSEVDYEGCDLNISVGKCFYNDTLNRCVKYSSSPAPHGSSSSKKTNVAAIVVPIVLIVVIVIALALIVFLKDKLSEFKFKHSIKPNGGFRKESTKNSREDSYIMVNEVKSPKITVTVIESDVPATSGTPILPSPAMLAFTRIACSRMDISPNFCEVSQPGLSCFQGLFDSDEHIKRKDFMDVLQTAGCSPSESQQIIQKIVVWAGKLPFAAPFTTHDAEVLGLYTNDYGEDFRMKSPTFKLSYALNMQDEAGICTHKDFLYLTLTSLRRLPLTNFRRKKLYFTMNSVGVSPENFPVGKTFKVMPFLTLLSAKDIALNTLQDGRGIIFEISCAEGYDITNYSITNPKSFGTLEIVIEPESVFRITNYKQISNDLAEVSLVYDRERSVPPFNNLIKGSKRNSSDDNNGKYGNEYRAYSNSTSNMFNDSYNEAPSAPSAPNNYFY